MNQTTTTLRRKAFTYIYMTMIRVKLNKLRELRRRRRQQQQRVDIGKRIVNWQTYIVERDTMYACDNDMRRVSGY